MTETVQQMLTKLYLIDSKPWLVGFSGGKDSTMVLSLVIKTILMNSGHNSLKPVYVLCTDTMVEFPPVAELVEKTLIKVQEYSQEQNLNLTVHLLRPSAEHSFWVNIIGRGYPPPNRNFRWCTQRLKIDPVSRFVENNIGRWGEAILLLGARKSESSSRAQTLAGIEKKSGLRHHPDLPRVWIANPIEDLSTEDVWNYLNSEDNPWGGSNGALRDLYASANCDEAPFQIDNSTPSAGNSRFGCWTCTVIERDKAAEGLIESGFIKMVPLLSLRKKLVEYRDPNNGMRDMRRMNGAEGPGPLTMFARRDLLEELLSAQKQTGYKLISEEELFKIQELWRSARNPDDGTGVGRIMHEVRGTAMNEPNKMADLSHIQELVCKEKDVDVDTLRRMIGKVEEYIDSHRAHGLPDDLLNILKDDMQNQNLTPEE